MNTMIAERKHINIPMSEMLNDRKLCREMAREISDRNEITGMSNSQLSCEIFAHAYVYVIFKYVPDFIKKMNKAQSIYRSVSDGVDIEDNGDSLVRRIFYRVVWMMPSIR